MVEAMAHVLSFLCFLCMYVLWFVVIWVLRCLGLDVCQCEVTEAEVSLQAHAANSSAYITSLCRSQLGDRCIAGWSDGGVTLI